MDYKELIELFDKELNLEKFDNKTAEDIYKKVSLFKLNLLQKNEEFMLFISSNLTGVYNAIFSSLDTEKFFSMFGQNEKKLEYKIHKLPDIVTDWVVSSNPLYLLCIYLIHKYINSSYKNAVEAITVIFEVMTYRMITSMNYNFFGIKLSVDEAKAVYEKFTYQFLVKKLGSWDAVIKYKAGLVLKDGTYYERTKRLTTKDATDVVAAIQTSYKSLFKYIKDLSVKSKKEKISSSSVLENTSEGKNIRDITNSSIYSNYIKSIVEFENDFINEPLIKIVANKIKNVEFLNIKLSLKYISQNYDTKNPFLDDIIVNSLEYLNTKNITNYTSDLEYINMLKGYWSSGNPKLKDTKQYLKDTVYKATSRKTDWILNSTTISIICYIFIRSMTKDKI